MNFQEARIGSYPSLFSGVFQRTHGKWDPRICPQVDLIQKLMLFTTFLAPGCFQAFSWQLSIHMSLILVFVITHQHRYFPSPVSVQLINKVPACLLIKGTSVTEISQGSPASALSTFQGLGPTMHWQCTRPCPPARRCLWIGSASLHGLHTSHLCTSSHQSLRSCHLLPL